MATVKNEVFIGLLHEKFYLVGKELTFGGGRNCSGCRVNYPYPPVGKTLLICIIYYIYIYIYICDIYKTHNKYIYIYIYIYMHNHTLFILHILTYDFLRILLFLRYGSSVGVAGVGNILFV